MTTLNAATLNLILSALKEACSEFMFLVHDDNRKTFQRATEQLEDMCEEASDYELGGKFADLRHDVLSLCPDNDEPHVWKIENPIWSTVRGSLVSYGRCVHCGHKRERGYIPVWQTIEKDDE